MAVPLTFHRGILAGATQLAPDDPPGASGPCMHTSLAGRILLRISIWSGIGDADRRDNIAQVSSVALALLLQTMGDTRDSEWPARPKYMPHCVRTPSTQHPPFAPEWHAAGAAA